MKQAIDALCAELYRKIAELRDHRQVFCAGEMSVEVRLFRDVPRVTFVSDQILLDQLALKEDLPLRHANKTGDQVHGGGFARTIWAKVAGDLTGPGGEAYTVDGGNAGEALRDVAEFEHEPSARPVLHM